MWFRLFKSYYEDPEVHLDLKSKHVDPEVHLDLKSKHVL